MSSIPNTSRLSTADVVFNKIDTFCNFSETCLAVASAIPGVHFISSEARIKILGCAQIVGGLALATIHSSAGLYVRMVNEDNLEAYIELKARTRKSLEYVEHGLLNIIRGVEEYCFLGLPLLVLYDGIACHLIGEEMRILNYNSLDYYRKQYSRPIDKVTLL